MSDRVPAEDIERLVGAKRHPTQHWARASSSEGVVFVLHSRECKESTPDLRTCPYSLALDRGIEATTPWAAWRHVMDRPVPVEIFRGYLMPRLLAVKAAIAAKQNG